MFKPQQITGPVAPAQYTTQQVSGPGSYYPLQTGTDMSSIFSSMMPMIMMIMIIKVKNHQYLWLQAKLFNKNLLNNQHQQNQIKNNRKNLNNNNNNNNNKWK